jgi:hypothetical protein
MLIARIGVLGTFSLTFDFLLAQRFNLSAVHLLGRFAFGAARFDRILVQIVGEPPQIAVANEGISCQMSVCDGRERD